MKKSTCVLVLVLAFGCFSGIQAASFTLHFDELPSQPVNGLTYMGVTFGFEIGAVPSTEANYNALGPGPTHIYVQDPSLVGSAAGVLTLDFAVPTDILEFGVALSTESALTPGFIVNLYDPSLTPLGTFPVNTSPLVTFTEGLFTISGPLIGRAMVSFAPLEGGGFALDNLTYELIPEPSSIGLVGTGLLVIGSLARRRAAKRSRNT